jgi:hypothetical protein
MMRYIQKYVDFNAHTSDFLLKFDLINNYQIYPVMKMLKMYEMILIKLIRWEFANVFQC